jgi:hypothetical protein
LRKEPTVYSEGKRVDVLDNRKALKRINLFITTLYSVHDDSLDGYQRTVEPHIKAFDINNYRVNSLVYSSNQALNILIKDMYAFSVTDGTLQSLNETLLAVSSILLESSNALISALERVIPDGSPRYGSSLASAAITGMDKSFEKLDTEFAYSFVSKVRSDDPSIEADIVNILIRIFNNKDKSRLEIADEDKKFGHLGVRLRQASVIPVLLVIFAEGPADIAKMQRGDIIMGVLDGPEFKSLADFWAFQKTTKPGEAYTYKIDRGGKSIYAKARLR